MVDIKTFKKLALSFPDTTVQPHFHLESFRVMNKIFATLWQKENRAMLKLSLVDQSVFCAYNKSIFFPVPGAWGKKGATFVELKKVRKDMFKDALTTAYQGVLSKNKEETLTQTISALFLNLLKSIIIHRYEKNRNPPWYGKVLPGSLR